METINSQESKYARSLIEASLDPLITINTGGKITDMNEALAKYYRYFTQKADRN